MSDRFAWICICILGGGHLSFPDADPGTTRLALSAARILSILCPHPKYVKIRNGHDGVSKVGEKKAKQ